MKKYSFLFPKPRILFSLLLFVVCSAPPHAAGAQAVPYARSFSKSKQEVDKALNEFQAYAGQKLPIVDGFVATGDQPLDRYQRAFYQFSIDLLPGATSDATIVRVSAKITAWYNDREPSKSGYQVLPSNGRLELDLLDRLTEKFGGKPVAFILRSEVQAPKPKIDLSAGSFGVSLPSRNSASPSAEAPATPGGEEAAALLTKRKAEEKRMLQLNAELQILQDIQRNQAYPSNLVIVKKSGTPVLARPAEGSRLLFTSAADDEFEFLDAEGEWIHVQISGVSRAYIRRSNLELPESIAARLKSPNGTPSNVRQEAFRLAREEINTFPGNWESLRGKSVKIYTVQPVSQDSKETGAQAKLNFAASLFQKFSEDSGAADTSMDGVVIIFDSANGGIIACTASDVQRLTNGSLSRDNFWKQCYSDPADAFQQRPKS